MSHDQPKTNTSSSKIGTSPKNGPKSTPLSNVESNLSVDEQNWLNSMKKRIQNGELIVAQTDKSRCFAIFSKKQYLKSGLVHMAKDLEIEPEKVKRVQNYVNDHVSWISGM